MKTALLTIGLVFSSALSHAASAFPTGSFSCHDANVKFTLLVSEVNLGNETLPFIEYTDLIGNERVKGIGSIRYTGDSHYVILQMPMLHGNMQIAFKDGKLTFPGMDCQ